MVADAEASSSHYSLVAAALVVAAAFGGKRDVAGHINQILGGRRPRQKRQQRKN